MKKADALYRKVSSIRLLLYDRMGDAYEYLLKQFAEDAKKNGGQFKTFDNVIANPPFGLSGWGAEAFESDQYGRNILGCPPTHA